MTLTPAQLEIARQYSDMQVQLHAAELQLHEQDGLIEKLNTARSGVINLSAETNEQVNQAIATINDNREKCLRIRILVQQMHDQLLADNPYLADL